MGEVEEIHNCIEFHTNFLDAISLDLRRDTVSLIHELSQPGAETDNARNRCDDTIQKIEKELTNEEDGIVCELVAKEMAECLRKMGLVDDAVDFIKACMERKEKEDFGGLLTLAHIYEISGEYQKAEIPKRKALQIAETSGDPVLISLALVKQACNFWHLQNQGRSKEKIRLSLDELWKCEVEACVHQYPFTSTTLRLIDTYKTLGYIHRFLGDRATSAEYYIKALDIVKQDREAMVHIFKLETQIGCEYSQSKTQKWKAQGYCLSARQQIKRMEENQAFMHHHSLTVIHALSRVAHALQFADDKSYTVLEIREELYHIAKKYLEQDHPEVARVAADTALLCNFLGASDKEDLYLEKAEAALEPCSASQQLHFLKLYCREISDAWKSLGLTYSKRRNFHETERCFQQGISVNTRVYGENHPRLARLYRSFGCSYRKCNQFPEALNCFKKCMEINDYYSPNDNQLRKNLKKDIAITKSLQAKSFKSY